MTEGSATERHLILHGAARDVKSRARDDASLISEEAMVIEQRQSRMNENLFLVIVKVPFKPKTHYVTVDGLYSPK